METTNLDNLDVFDPAAEEELERIVSKGGDLVERFGNARAAIVEAKRLSRAAETKDSATFYTAVAESIACAFEDELGTPPPAKVQKTIAQLQAGDLLDSEDGEPERVVSVDLVARDPDRYEVRIAFENGDQTDSIEAGEKTVTVIQ